MKKKKRQMRWKPLPLINGKGSEKSDLESAMRAGRYCTFGNQGKVFYPGASDHWPFEAGTRVSPFLLQGTRGKPIIGLSPDPDGGFMITPNGSGVKICSFVLFGSISEVLKKKKIKLDTDKVYTYKRGRVNGKTKSVIFNFHEPLPKTHPEFKRRRRRAEEASE